MGSVSVVVPCYNYGRHLTRCVESILDQAVDVEVLVIDDCSADDTADVGTELARDARVTFRRHQHNLGHLATYNEGLAWASGDYTVLLSADDLLTPGSLARAARVLDAHPEVGMAYGRVVRFGDDPPAAEVRRRSPDLWDGASWIERRTRTATCPIASPEVMVRTSLQHALGGYRPDLPHTGDLEMWLRIAAHAKIAFLRGADQAFYRVHSMSMSRTTFQASIADLEHRKAAFDAHFDGHGRGLADLERLREQVARALAGEALWRACRAFDRKRLDAVSVDELEAFAFATYPAAHALAEHRGLRERRRCGAAWSSLLQFGRPSVYRHRLGDWLWWKRVALSGV